MDVPNPEFMTACGTSCVLMLALSRIKYEQALPA